MSIFEEMMLNPNCSESVSRIGIKKSELSYIKKRIKDLGYEDGDEILEEFTDYLDKADDVGSDMMSESIAGDYTKIRDEILAKRKSEICSFCQSKVDNVEEHLKKYHKEEAVWVYDNVTKEGINKMRKEVVYNNLQ